MSKETESKESELGSSDSVLRTKTSKFVIVLIGVTYIVLLYAYWWMEPSTFDQKSEFIKLAAQATTAMAVIFGLSLTYENVRTSQRNVILTQRTVENASEQLQIDRDTKVAELFYKASEQLSMESVHRRVAGIHTLARIAQKHEDFYQQFVEVLVAYINTHTLGQDKTSLQAAVDALCNREHCYLEGEETPLSFSQVDFDGITFRRGDFCKAMFSECTFKGASFIDSRFNHTDFLFSDLSGFTWDGTDFRGADFFNSTCRMVGSFPIADEVPTFRTKRLMRVGEGKNVSFTRVIDQRMVTKKRSELLEIPESSNNKGVAEVFDYIRKHLLVEEGALTDEEFNRQMKDKMVDTLSFE